MKSETKGDLALKVFDSVYQETETFREENIGADLAYLMGAILDTGEESYVDWSTEAYGEKPPALLEILKRIFPPGSSLWNYIVLNDQTLLKKEETEMSLNKILLMGNMVTDPEIRYTAAGKPVACFRVETSRRFLVKGERRQESEIFSIAAFGRLAEVAAELAKGRQIFVEGRVQNRKWQDSEGSWRTRTEVVAESIRLVGNNGTHLT